MITERTLRQWRKDALVAVSMVTQTDPLEHVMGEQAERILRLTQELLDQHLIRKG